MPMPDYLTQLLDRAKEKAGSDYQIAKMLHATPQTVSDWRHGRRTCPIGGVVLLADIAGLDPDAWLRRALVTQYEGTPKGDHLYRLLICDFLRTGLPNSHVYRARNGSQWGRLPSEARYRLCLDTTRTGNRYSGVRQLNWRLTRK